MKDYYYILGVSKNATQVEINLAYRKLSKKFHPDLNKQDKFWSCISPIGKKEKFNGKR